MARTKPFIGILGSGEQIIICGNEDVSRIAQGRRYITKDIEDLEYVIKICERAGVNEIYVPGDMSAQLARFIARLDQGFNINIVGEHSNSSMSDYLQSVYVRRIWLADCDSEDDRLDLYRWIKEYSNGYRAVQDLSCKLLVDYIRLTAGYEYGRETYPISMYATIDHFTKYPKINTNAITRWSFRKVSLAEYNEAYDMAMIPISIGSKITPEAMLERVETMSSELRNRINKAAIIGIRTEREDTVIIVGVRNETIEEDKAVFNEVKQIVKGEEH